MLVDATSHAAIACGDVCNLLQSCRDVQAACQDRYEHTICADFAVVCCRASVCDTLARKRFV
jgi:hypothetical protein